MNINKLIDIMEKDKQNGGRQPCDYAPITCRSSKVCMLAHSSFEICPTYMKYKKED